MYTKKQLIADATKEAIALKEHATKNELNKLNFDLLDANHICKCIYGQMTGDCFSHRAAQLIEKCTPRYFSVDYLTPDSNITTMKKISAAANGTEVENFEKQRVNAHFESPHFSAIEAYIAFKGNKNKNLIAYLKGETNDLNL